MSAISQDVSQIRSAVYGKDVREAIADGIEQCYTDVSSGVTMANTAATAANTAAAAANTAATAANGAATKIAAAYSSSSTYAVGDYVSYNNNIYRCTTAITTAEEWTAAHWTAVTIGDEVSDLKSAFDTFSMPFVPSMIHGRLDSQGNFVESTDRWVTEDYLPTAYLAMMDNNTSGGTTYVDYYNLVDGSYVFAEYDSTQPGSTYTFDQSKGTHVRLYSTHNSSGQNVVLHQYVQKLKDMYDSMLGDLAPIHPSRYGAPNFDTVNGTFTILHGTTIYAGDNYYLISTDISCNLSSYTSHKIIYNIANGTLSDIRYSNAVPKGSLLVALYTSAGKTAAMSCTYCINKNLYNINTSDIYGMRNYNIKSVNHRGYNSEYPENTLIAFKASRQHGFEWIETDVQYTSDGVPVILHDSTINRTARNADETEISTTVNISDITYSQALDYDFGIWKGSEFAGTKIPTFEECISLCRNIGLKVRVELKNGTVTTARIPGLIAIIEKYAMQDNVEFASFNHSLIDYINQNYHKYSIAYIQSRYSATLLDEVQAIMNTRDDFTVSMNISEDVNTDANLALMQGTGAKIDFYTITASGESTIIEANTRASSFTTNKINVGEYLYEYYRS